MPRLINLIADRSLLAGMATGAGTIDGGVAEQAIHNLQLKKYRSGTGLSTWSKALFGMRRTALVVGLSILLALALVAIVNGVGG